MRRTASAHISVNVQEAAVRAGNSEVGGLCKTSSDYNHEGAARLAWKDLTVKVVNQKGKLQTVLHSLSGVAQPGRFLAIMGPSGSGKSTLLDTLAGRLAANATQMGTILLNGERKKLSFGATAYVTQEDNLIGTLTVRESIWYSMELRLPKQMGREKKEEIVNKVMEEMGLEDCGDTPVGNWHLRGISGGEKRRVSIAIEILTRPHLLFLDEPTSGLDSASAFFVTKTIRNLARDGRTIIASIHQPSSEVFELFDDLFLLSSGRTIFFGPASEACNFFASTGFPCPARRNPSDHFLRCINSDFDRVKATKASIRRGAPKYHDPLDNFTTTQVIDVLLHSYEASPFAIQTASQVHEFSQITRTILESKGSQANFWTQMCALTRRSFTNMYRDVGYYWLRLIIYALVSLCVGLIFLNVGTSYEAIMARSSCGAFIFGFVTFMSIGGFPSFVEDMKVFQKERLNGHYGVLPFVMANTLSSMPFLFIISMVSSIICYFMVGLHPGFENFMFFALTLYASVMVVESLMMVIASVIPNFLMGIIIGAGLQGIFMLVAGYFRLPKNIPKPVWKYPLSYLSFDHWSIQGQFKNDLLGLEFDNGPSMFPPKLTGAQILDQFYQIDLKMNKWVDLAMIFSMVVMYRLFFLGMIKMKENVSPWVRGKLAHYSLQMKASRAVDIAP